MTIQLTADHAAAVDHDYYWRGMDTCPLGVKVMLLTDGGVAIFGNITTDTRDHFEAWSPLPKRQK